MTDADKTERYAGWLSTAGKAVSLLDRLRMQVLGKAVLIVVGVLATIFAYRRLDDVVAAISTHPPLQWGLLFGLSCIVVGVIGKEMVDRLDRRAAAIDEAMRAERDYLRSEIVRLTTRDEARAEDLLALKTREATCQRRLDRAELALRKANLLPPEDSEWADNL